MITLNSEQVEKILQNLHLPYTTNSGGFSMSCPIHSGDNPTGFSIRRDGVWTCWTHQCHRGKARNPIGLVQVLRNINYVQATEEVKKILGGNFELPPPSNLRAFIEEVRKSDTQVELPYAVPVEKFAGRSLPANNYFTTNKKICLPTLKEFGVFLCTDPKSKFLNRIVVPMFDRTKKLVVGGSGRTTLDKCSQCQKFHNIGMCGQSYPKWLHSKDLRHHLYNVWNYKDYPTVILVEGPTDCFKFWDAGIYNTIALLGTSLTRPQKLALNKLPIFDILVAMDGDFAGQKASNILLGQLQRLYNTKILEMPEGGPSSLTTKEIQCLLKS